MMKFEKQQLSFTIHKNKKLLYQKFLSSSSLVNQKKHLVKMFGGVEGVKRCQSTLSHDHNISPIKSFFNEKNVFITGATGFVGKVII